ncbi:MAG: cysteine desulfurase [Clostridia bacterium]|nr:cysteine desulfurase [Clostridia bacterium]
MLYFDNAATTAPSLMAIEKAQKFNSELYFNPSTLYSGGLNCAREIKLAKESVLKNLGATNNEVIFTSCGSESDNLAIFGCVKRGVFVTDKGEHSAVYKSFLELKNRGQKIEFVDLNSDGSVNEENLISIVKELNADFVSIVHVNNETGAINDVNSIANKLKTINKKIIFHVDGVQAYGKIPYKLSQNIDFYAISAHKINGLKGVGALIRKKGVNLSPLIFGGGQENGLRSGTENVFGIKVFQYAGEEKYSCLLDNFSHVKQLKNVFIEQLNKDIFTIISSENSSPYVLCVSAKGLRGEVVMHALESQGLIVGNGSACSSKNRFSRVIEACGYGRDVLDGVIRISFCAQNTLNECYQAVEIINKTVEQLKGILK